MSKLRVCKLRRTPWMITWLYQPNSRELSAFRVCMLVQSAEFRLTCNGFIASLSGFVSWFSADFGMQGRFSHQRSIHRKRSTFKWLQRRAVVRLNICKSVFPVLHYHGTGGAYSRLNDVTMVCYTPSWPLCSSSMWATFFLPVASLFSGMAMAIDLRQAGEAHP